MKVGDLVRLAWCQDPDDRPVVGEWGETWIVIEDHTMIIALDPENPYPAGEVTVWDNGELANILVSDLEIVNE